VRLSLALSPKRGRFAPLFFQGDLVLGLRAAAELGYDGVELSLASPTEVSPDVRRSLRELDLGVSAIGTGRVYYDHGVSLLSPRATDREAAIGMVRELVRLAGDLRCPYVILGGARGRYSEAGLEDSGAARARLLEGLSLLADEARSAGVKLLLEPINRYETDCVNTAAEALELLDDLGEDDAFGILLDTFHMNIEEPDPLAAVRAAGERLEYVHFADSNRRVAGYGHISFGPVLEAIRQHSRATHVGVEALPLPEDREAAAAAARHFRALLEAVGGGEALAKGAAS